MAIKTKHIPYLPRPKWLDAAGMGKGIDHDRQHLSIVLAASQTIKARQTNTAFTGELTLRLLNDDSQTEASKKVGNDWAELSASVVSVPFIDTPYTDTSNAAVEPVVEYEYPDGSKQLPVYRKGQSQTDFFNHWDNQGSEFALLDSSYTQVLVPVIDKEALRHPQEVDDIDGLIGYYESVFSFYNALAGLSFEPERPSDLNSTNRYFMKADKHGAGGAYYGQNWTAASTNAIKDWWLLPSASNWGNLHEIGHGYQMSFRNDRYFWNGEVSNNVYAAVYQSAYLGDRKYQEGWLYNYGKQAQVEQGIMDDITSHKSLNDWDLRAKLYFLVLMVEKAGVDSFADFNQQYRLVSNQPKFDPTDHLLLDMLSDSFSRIGHIDVTPFVELCSGYISPGQRELNQFGQGRAVYPLNQLVGGDTLTKLQEQLKLQSPLTLVSVSQLLASGIKGDVTLELKIDDFSQIYGETITVLDGSRYVRQLTVETENVALGTLPIGVYTLRLPLGRNSKYQVDQHYLLVKPGSAQVLVNFVPQTGSQVTNQEIKLLGLGDDLFSTILVDQANYVVQVAVTRKDPHSYFGNETYAEVIIKDSTGKEQFRATMPGVGATLSDDKIAFKPGYILEVYHAEPSHRIQLRPDFDGVIDHAQKTNIFEITASGLKNQSLNNDPLAALLARIEAAATALRSHPTLLHAECPSKVDIWLAIDQFTGSQRDDLLKQYSDCIPSENNAPSEGLGNSFTAAFKGIGDWQFLTAELDFVGRKLAVALRDGIAHHYFNDTYAALQVLDADGNELLNLDVKGSTSQTARNWTLPISGYGGEVLNIRHEEAPTRLFINNNMRDIRLSGRETRQNYRVTSTGLELLTRT
ncbi:Viral enhancin protein [Aspergillus parasiticus SU-1]|uniref:Viral enhancin protein n=1 Tax=Aspergillus parasiticus (strain ATCC 56775 / NRRL 5862 / SRRC 143 / SU-1) TaxID=1403190 RepID=A0A0F0I1R5_ASPPU|nr:Viral enhancin protein [Aspergillus parasiticus SU-1]